jgi:hypothetical protein
MNYTEFVKWLADLDLATVDGNPISFKTTDFEEEADFGKSMFLAGQRFHSEEDIVVRYSKPFNEDKSDVIVQFQIVRSKAKMFFNFFKNNDYEKLGCFLTSNKDYKEFVKFFNSLGVKDDDGNSISSKELDYVSTFKDVVEETKNTFGEGQDVYIFVSLDLKRDIDDNEYIAMTYAPILKDNMSKREEQYHVAFGDKNHCGMFPMIKEYVKKEILNIKE